MIRHRLAAAVFAAAVPATLPAVALAQGFPDRTIRIVVPYPPGGSTDLVARIMADSAGELLKQSIVVENRTGAAGMIGASLSAKSPADGYTLGACTVGNCAILQTAEKKTADFDFRRDATPVFLVGGVMNVFVVNPSVPAKSVRELVALAKARPGKINYGSGGIGNSPHMTVELLQYREKISMLHVPYKGSGPAIIDTIGGQVDTMVENEPSILSHIHGGKLRAIAVTGPKRSARLPDIQSMVEQGYQDFVVEAWFGYFAPAKTPRPVIDRLNAAFNTALGNPRVRARLDETGVNIAGGPPERFGELISAETEKWGRVIKANNIKLD